MILYAISDRTLFPDRDAFLQASRTLMEAGLDWLQVREKDLSDREVLTLARNLVEASSGTRTRVLVNGRFDVALAAGAAGVHLTSSGMPTQSVRRQAPAPFLILRSTHHVEEVRRAEGEGADAVTFGPVFPTPSKARYGPPVGLERLAEARRASGIRILGLGGIVARDVPRVLDAGADGIAAIRFFWTLDHPQTVLPRLRTTVPPR